ncbi:mannose-1-phosphate guanylyltransferase [Phenylobacterium sp.]|uniref:mannose-1-phosphate guanylyltransferase n=1 Tax=Phenylobacterium sp. TaxID=1871053 RepID=UPI0035B111A1
MRGAWGLAAAALRGVRPVKITPVILSGGSGTRLWPLSRPERPKQFHAFGASHTLIQETALRLRSDLFEPAVVLAGAEHGPLVAAQLSQVGATPQSILLEPAARNTAAAAAAAAAFVARDRPERLMMLIHADNRVADVAALHGYVRQAAPAAERGQLVLFALKPSAPATIYGYIKLAPGEGVRPVEAFVEKPDLARAQAFLADGGYGWNAGMFLFRADSFLEELGHQAPTILSAAAEAVRTARPEPPFLRLGSAFLQAPSEPIDTAVFEKTDRAAGLTVDIGWSDVGNWDAIWAEAAKDSSGNAFQGPVTAAGSAACLVVSDQPVVLAGVRDLVVVVHEGEILIARRDDPKGLQAALRERSRLAKSLS